MLLIWWRFITQQWRLSNTAPSTSMGCTDFPVTCFGQRNVDRMTVTGLHLKSSLDFSLPFLVFCPLPLGPEYNTRSTTTPVKLQTSEHSNKCKFLCHWVRGCYTALLWTQLTNTQPFPGAKAWASVLQFFEGLQLWFSTTWTYMVWGTSMNEMMTPDHYQTA